MITIKELLTKSLTPEETAILSHGIHQIGWDHDAVFTIGILRAMPRPVKPLGAAAYAEELRKWLSLLSKNMTRFLLSQSIIL